MDDEYLNAVLTKLSQNQKDLKNNLGEALLRTEIVEEKTKIQELLNFNDEIEKAIANKDIDKLQNLIQNANFNK
ncbi:MAG: hypothetical protein WCH21_04655 [Bacteroidota bacterium]|jgi:hypothetical protein